MTVSKPLLISSVVAGIICGMREVRPMWNMCRLLAEHRHEWVPQLAQARAYDANKEMIERFSGTPHFDAVLNQETYLEMLHGENSQGDLKIRSNGLLYTYITKYMWTGKSKIINISTNTEHQAELTKARAILNHCINHNPPFIRRDGDLIYLTAEGESFAADLFGLFKQYLIEMGIFWAFISALILGLLPYLVPLIINLVQNKPN